MLQTKFLYTLSFFLSLFSSYAYAQPSSTPKPAYTPTLDAVNTNIPDLRSAYQISFFPTQSVGSCYTDFKMENNKAHVFYYDCNISPLNKKFSNSRTVINNRINGIKAHFYKLYARSGNQAVALINNSQISEIYADFVSNMGSPQNATATFINNGYIKNFNGDFTNNVISDTFAHVNKKAQTSNTDIGTAFINTTNGKISQMNANFIKNDYSTDNTGRNSIFLNQGNISNLNSIFSGHLLFGQGKENSVLTNDGSIISFKGHFSSNTIRNKTNDSNSTAIGNSSILSNNGNINLLEANFIANNCRITDFMGGGCAVNLAPQAKIFTIRNSYFIGNELICENTDCQGGAVRVLGTIEGEIVNSSFLGNKALPLHSNQSFGGAIYSETPLSFSVNGNYKSIFSGNTAYADGLINYNAFYLKNTYAVFTINEEGGYIFNDSFDGQNYHLYLRGNKSGVFDFNNEIANAQQIRAEQAIIRFGKSTVAQAKLSNVSEFFLNDSRLLLNNKHYDTIEVNALNSSNGEIDIDLNVDDMKSDLISVRNYLSGTPVKINIHLNQDKDIIGQQPILFATTGSFNGNRNSFLVNKVFGGSHMFDILYKEEDSGLKKNWFLVMNEHQNPDFGTQAQTEEEQKLQPEKPKEPQIKSTPLPECHGNIACNIFKLLGKVNTAFFIFNAKMQEWSKAWFQMVEQSLFKIGSLLNKAVIYFAPEQQNSAEETSAEPNNKLKQTE